MRKIFILLLALCSLSIQAKADDGNTIDFSVEIIKETPIHYPHPKQPVRMPSASIEGHTLTFLSCHAEYELNIVQDGEVVYSTTVASDDMQVTLPANLTGDCELQLIQGNFYFIGTINL